MSPRRFKWGLVGYGDLAGKRVAAALRAANHSELCGVWGRNYERACQFAAAHGVPRTYCSLTELVESDVDAVYICTPPDSHADYALTAIAAGRHVLVEKPMAADGTGAEKMVREALNRGVHLGVAYYRRAYPKMREVKRLIDTGVLGVPTFAHVVNHTWFDPAETDPKHWRIERAKSGGAGALADVGVHRIDLFLYWLGDLDACYADFQHLVHGYEVEDGSAMAFRAKCGAPITAYFGWNSKTFSDRFEIVGTEGKIIIDPLDGESLTVIRGRERSELRFEVPANAHLPCVEDFIEAVCEGRAPLCSGAEGLKTNRLLAHIIELSAA